MSRPLMRAVTATMRLRSSRLIWGCPVTGTMRATRLRGKRWPSGARMRRWRQVGHGVAQPVGNPDPHPDHLDPALHMGGDGAAEGVLQQARDRLGVDPLERRLAPVDVDLQGVAGGIDAVLHPDDPLDPTDFAGDGLCRRIQLFGVVGEEFDFHRLRHGGEIADEIFHQLGHLDIETGNLLFDPGANGVHHLPDGPARAGLETDEEVALVGLGQGPPEGGAGAARIGVDGGIVLDDLFHLSQQPVRFGEGGAGRTAIVEDEAPLVHARHEPRADLTIGQPAGGEQGHHQQQDQQGPGQKTGEQGLVTAVEPVGKPPPFLLIGILFAEQVIGENRHGQPGDQEGDEEGRGHGQRERLEKGAGHPAQESERDEDDHGGGAGAGQRGEELEGRFHHPAVVARRRRACGG